MIGMGEHIYGLDSFESIVFLTKESQISGQSGGVAGDVNDLGRSQVQKRFHHVFMQAGARRIDHHQIGDLFVIYKFCQDFFHLSADKLAIGDAFQL